MSWEGSEQERWQVDPERRYSVEGMTALESRALEMLKLLPGAQVQRTRDVIQLNWQGENGLVVLVTPDSVEFRRPSVEWTCGSYAPALTSRLLKRVELINRKRQPNFSKLIQQVLQSLRSQMRQCRYCRQAFLPERMHSEDVCHGCAEQYLGVVH